MTKKLLAIAILAISTSLFSSCETNESSILDKEPELGGKYQLYMDDELVAEGSTEEVGMVQGTDGVYYNTVTIAKGTEFSIMLTGFSKTVGETIDEVESDPGVVVMGYSLLKTDNSEEMYFSEDGTIVRESKSKMTFSGTCKEMLGTDSHTFSGFIESDAFKIIQ